MKKFWLFFLVVLSMFSTIVYAGNLVKKVYFSPYPIEIDGEEYSSEMPILQYQERTYVALREFSEMINVDVDFIENKIVIKSNDKNVGEVDTQIKMEDEHDENKENATLKTNVVYISKSGKKYHKLSNCNNATYFEVTLSEAISEGYTPCLRCAK